MYMYVYMYIYIVGREREREGGGRGGWIEWNGTIFQMKSLNICTYIMGAGMDGWKEDTYISTLASIHSLTDSHTIHIARIHASQGQRYHHIINRKKR